MIYQNQQEIATPDNKRKQRVRSQLKIGTTRWMTYAATFAALALVMKYISQFLTFTPSFKLTLVYTIWLIAGATLGPAGGAAVCFTSDVLGSINGVSGSINPYVIIGNTTFGLIAGLVFRYTPSRSYIVRFVAAGIACIAACTCMLNTLALWVWYKLYESISFWAYFIGERPLQIAVAGINVAVTVAMIPLLTRLKLLPTIQKEKETKEQNQEQEEQNNA